MSHCCSLLYVPPIPKAQRIAGASFGVYGPAGQKDILGRPRVRSPIDSCTFVDATLDDCNEMTARLGGQKLDPFVSTEPTFARHRLQSVLGQCLMLLA